MRIKSVIYQKIGGRLRQMLYHIASFRKMPIPIVGEKIDVIIPVVAKDLAILPLCLEGIRRNCSNQIDKIYLVSPNESEIKDFSKKNNLVFVDENFVLGYSKKEINYYSNGKDRSGWLLQQFIKLSGCIGSNRYYLTIDADHILLQPHTFLAENGGVIFYVSSEYYYPYYSTIKYLSGHFPYECFSYISHKMLFDKHQLALMKSQIEKRHKGESWDQAILEILKKRRELSFSEFETYGYMSPSHNKILIPWKQKELQKCGQTINYMELKCTYGKKYLSVTFPDYRAK